MRPGASIGASAYYRLIGSAYAGEPVRPGDAQVGAGNGKRGMLLVKYSGDQTNARKDSPADPLIVQARERG